MTDKALDHKNRTIGNINPKAEAFLSALIKAKKDLQLYPPDNPVVAESLDYAHRLLRDACPDQETLEFRIEKETLFVKGRKTGATDSRVREFSLSLYRRGLHRIVFDSSLSSNQLKALIETLNMKIEDLAAAGGVGVLVKQKGIKLADLEESTELMIVDGTKLSLSDDVFEELNELDLVNATVEQLRTPEGISTMFLRVEEGDLTAAKRLRALLADPTVFTKVLEKFSFQLRRTDAKLSPTSRAERMLEMLRVVGSAITSLPSEDDRDDLMKNLALSILELSAEIRTDLVNHGIMPNLALKSVESSILSRFPAGQLSDVLLENFQVSGAAASMMKTYLGGIDFNAIEKTELVKALHEGMEQRGILTPELDHLLSSELVSTESMEAVSVEMVAPAEAPVPSIEGFPPEKVLFAEDERAMLFARATEELDDRSADLMVPVLLDMLHHENTPADYQALFERAASYMEQFLAAKDYSVAAQLIKGLQADMERKEEAFSNVQLRTIHDVLDSHLGNRGIKKLIDTLGRTKGESEEFENLVTYFKALGNPAIKGLLKALEDEQSRYVRLLICNALSQMGEMGITPIGEKLDNAEWYVARNAVSVLGQIGVPESIPYLQKALSHNEIRVRKEALKALASIRTPDAMDILCTCVDFSDAALCKAALGWIAAIGPDQAYSVVERLLTAKNVFTMDSEIIRLAIEALGSIGSEPALALLEKLTHTRHLFRRKKAAYIRQTAVQTIAGCEGR